MSDTSTQHTSDPKTGKGFAETVRGAADDAVGAVRDQATDRAEAAKSSAAGEVDTVAEAMRSAAKDLADGTPQERVMDEAAHRLSDLSDAIKRADLQEFVGAATGFARRNPMLFLGSAAVLGFAMARFAKSSGESQMTAGGPGSEGRHGATVTPTPRHARTPSANAARPGLYPEGTAP